MIIQSKSHDQRPSVASFRAWATEGWRGRDRPLLRLGAGLTLIASGVIHGAQITSHLGASRVAGLFFVGVAALQVALGVSALGSQSRRVRAVTLVVTVGTIAIWVASRTVGIAIAGHTETVGVADAVATGLEVVTATSVGALLLDAGRRRPDVDHSRAANTGRMYVMALMMTLAIAAVTAAALRPVPLHGHQDVRDESSATIGNQKLLDLLDHHGPHTRSDRSHPLTRS